MWTTRKHLTRVATGGLLAALLVLTACSGSDESDTQDGNGEAEGVDETVDDTNDGDGAAESEGPDELVFALLPPNPETNRVWATSGSGAVLQVEPMMERLLGNDPETGELVPELALEWEANDDFTEWTFQLREGVEFHHNWGEFTGEDVAHSIELAGGDDSIFAQAALYAETEVEIIDRYEVVVIFPEPQVFAGALFSGERPDGQIYSKAQWDEEGIDGIDEQPAGTGIYMYESRSEGESITFVRNPDHWSGDQAAFERLRFVWEPEDSTRLARVLSGEAHVTDVGRELHPQAEDAGLSVLTAPRANHQSYLIINGQSLATEGYDANPDIPWTDARVRRALNMALNRDEIIEFIYQGGDVEPAINIGWTAEKEGWNEAWVNDFDEYYGYDPERAVELIAEAGFSPEDINPTLWSFALAGNPEFPLLLEFIQAQWEQIGVRATIEETQADNLVATIPNRAEAEQYIYPLRNLPIREPELFYTDIYSAGSIYGTFNTSETEAIWNEWRTTFDEAERDRLSRELGDIMFYESATIPIAEFGASIVVDPSVVGSWRFPGTAAGMSHWHLLERAGS